MLCCVCFWQLIGGIPCHPTPGYRKRNIPKIASACPAPPLLREAAEVPDAAQAAEAARRPQHMQTWHSLLMEFHKIPIFTQKRREKTVRSALRAAS